MTDTERKAPVRLPDLANINTDAQLNLNWRKTMKFICVLSMSHVIFGIYLHLKKNGIVSLQWKFSWATHILSGNPNLEKQLGYPRHVAFIVFCVLGSEILILSNHW